ncbi:hypothetical protein L209DRAFT_747047 [Thermothelomyces heterothallicus CBS 203.75]
MVDNYVVYHSGFNETSESTGVRRQSVQYSVSRPSHLRIKKAENQGLKQEMTENVAVVMASGFPCLVCLALSSAPPKAVGQKLGPRPPNQHPPRLKLTPTKGSSLRGRPGGTGAGSSRSKLAPIHPSNREAPT